MGRKTAIPFYYVFLCLISTPIPFHGQVPSVKTQESFNQLLLSAYQNSSEDVVPLIRDHRLWVKPFIEEKLHQSIVLELTDSLQQANLLLQMCDELAALFQKIHGEQSLNFAVDYQKIWNTGQKELKIVADSLYESATDLRSNRSTRDQALELYLRALEIYDSIGDRRGKAATFGGLGVVYWYQRDVDKVLERFQQALIARQEVDDQQLIGNTLGDLASYYRAFLKDYDRSNEYYKQAMEVRSKIGDQSGLAKCYRFSGENYWDLGDLSTALDYFNKAAVVFVAEKDSVNAGRVFHNSGILLRRMARYPESLAQFERALMMREAGNDYRAISATLVEMGTVYKKMGDFENALRQYEKQLAYFEKQDDQRGTVQCLINIGTILSQLKRPHKALQYYKKAESLEEKSDSPELLLDIWSNIGVAYYELDSTNTAAYYHKNAIELSRRQKNLRVEANNLINLGNVYNQSGNLDAAVVCYEQAKIIAETINDPALLWPVNLGLGDNYEKRQQNEQALEYYNEALLQIENVHAGLRGSEYQAEFLANQRYIYEAIIHLISRIYDTNKNEKYAHLAFEYAEKARAREFLGRMAEAVAGIHQGTDPALLQQQQELLDQIIRTRDMIGSAAASGNSTDSLKQKLTEKEEQYRKLKILLRQKNPKYASLQFPEIKALSEIQEKYLNENTVVLAYLVGDSSSVLWVITPQTSAFYRLPNREKISEQIELIRFALLNPRQPAYDIIAKSGFNLYQTLLAPAAEMIQPEKELIIIPDDILFMLPFETLSVEEVSLPGHDLPYLFKTNPISYFPSATILAQLMDEKKNKRHIYDKSILAIGDPLLTDKEYDGQNLRPLPYSGQEVKQIAGFTPPGSSDILLQKTAREDLLINKIKTNSYRNIHFATHGVIDDKKPDFSGLVLSGNENSDEYGLLLAAEIFNLPFHSDLVVLSACESGLGKMIRGEGMVGLTRAFMYAGASSVIATLWRVADLSTYEFMKEFYSKLIQKKESKSRSLGLARTKLLQQKEFAHPFYWAPFILIGSSE